jgi:hypothetical protein
MSSTPQAPPPPPQIPQAAAPAPAAAKKTSPLIWVLVGCGGLVLLAAIIMLVAGVFVAKKVGSYAKDAEKNPAMAAAKLIVAMNPELETVSTDDSAGTITIRNKKTGEVITVDLDDVKKGKIRFKNEKGESAEISASGEGETGKIEVKSDKGTMTFGAGGSAEAPDWVPAYPGSQPEGMYSAKGAQGTTAAFTFDTEDAPEKVIAFYEEKLKDAGFEVTTSTFKKGATLSGGLINAVAEAEKRQVHVTVSAEDAGTKVAVNFVEGEGM